MPDKTDKAVIATSAITGTATIATVTTTALGFTSSGIAAGSTAAVIQAGIGNVVAGSAFAGVQSLAATGVIYSVGLVSGVGLGACAIYGGYKLYKLLKKSPS
jgi:hypothetical protein